MAGAPHGVCAGGHGGRPRRARTIAAHKKVVVPPEPHTEPVTGNINADRIAFSAGNPGGKGPEPSDDTPPQSPRPVVRRIATPSRDDEQ
jgi:hypothetical protein